MTKGRVTRAERAVRPCSHRGIAGAAARGHDATVAPSTKFLANDGGGLLWPASPARTDWFEADLTIAQRVIWS
jgi:hypothetical protein